jgi:anti-sigma factor RsiW
MNEQHRDAEEPLDAARLLMMKALDGCLEPEEERAWAAALAADPALRAELASFEQTAAVMGAFRERTLVDRRAREAARGGRRWVAGAAGLGVGLALLGACGAGVAALLLLPEVPLVIKLAVGAVSGVLALALGWVVWERARLAPRDRYTEVDR